MKEINDMDALSNVQVSTKSPTIWIKTFVKAIHKKIVLEFVVTSAGDKDVAPLLVEKGLKLLKEKIIARGGKIIK